MNKPFLCWSWKILEELGQYHGCSCPGSLHHQVISSQLLLTSNISTSWKVWVTFAILTSVNKIQIEGLVQECSKSIAIVLELLQCCPKPLIDVSEK